MKRISYEDEYQVVISPQKSLSFAAVINDIWTNKDLAWALALRDIQIRYKQSLLGIAWAVFQPLITTIIFSLIFGVLVKIPTGEVPYPVFVLSGLLVWQYFSKVVVESTGSLVKNEAIITKVFFPRLLLPLVPIISSAVDLFISLIILILVMLFFGMTPSYLIIFMPLVIILAGILGYALGMIFAPINAIYRDVAIALPFFVQVGMYLTPVIYPVGFIPEEYQWITLLNPVATILDTGRAFLLGSPFPSWEGYLILIGFILCFSVTGFKTFHKLEPVIVDRI